MKRPYKKRRKYRTRQDSRMRLLLLLAGLALAVFGLVNLAGYGWSWLSARRTSKELQAVYHASSTEEPAAATPDHTAVPTPEPTQPKTVSPVKTALPTPSPVTKLQSMAYPGNPGLQISSRFKALRQESRYIVGWLNMEKLLDEPVVQRDDDYYLTHDAMGKENVNGAIFLGASVRIRTRPYTYILYGHNMKTGAMFGCLRNFENRSFYHANPFITFDTLYEDGRYVIFAVSSVSTEENVRNSLDFYALQSTEIGLRSQAISGLISASVHTCEIDVQPDDQLLILVTCVEKENERRVVAACRIRDGESEAALRSQVERSRKK